MPSHALDQRLFEQTIGAFGDDGATTATPVDGAKLINDWLRVIDGNTSADIIESPLKELRGQLQLPNPDPDRIRGLLLSIADSTSQIAQGSNVQEQTANKLENVVRALRRFAGQL